VEAVKIRDAVLWHVLDLVHLSSCSIASRVDRHLHPALLVSHA
jgi:hypothetical protein